jgi:hypothetical protein
MKDEVLTVRLVIPSFPLHLFSELHFLASCLFILYPSAFIL